MNLAEPILRNAGGAPGGSDVEWHCESRKLVIAIATELLGAIPAAVMRASKENPAREIGGILFGVFGEPAGGKKFSILEVKWVASESSRYNTSDSELNKLEAAVRSAAVGGQVPVGYIRSDLREGFCPSEQDMTLIGRCFPDSTSIAFLVRPFSMGACMAGIFVGEAGVMDAPVPEIEIPMFPGEANLEEAYGLLTDTRTKPKLSEPAAEKTDVRSDADDQLQGADSGEQSVAAPRGGARIALVQRAGVEGVQTRYAPAVARRASLIPKVLKTLALCACFVLFGAAAAILFRTSKSALASPAPQGIGLRVERTSGGQLNVFWNPNLRQKAELLISDGTVRRTVSLDLPQMRTGRMAYFPHTADPSFQMTVQVDSTRSISESLQLKSEKSPRVYLIPDER